MVKFGILGCGMIASVNADAIFRIPSAKLVGVVDSSYAVAREFAQKRGVRAFETYEQMLDEVDAVVICTPSYLHAQNAITALNSDKHVVLEKPMGLNTQEVDQIIECVERTGKVFTVISQARFSEDLIKAKELLEQNAFGVVSLFALTMKYYRSSEYYGSSNWKGRLKYEGGGALMNQGIHGVDVLQYLAGEVKSVSGIVKTLSHDIEIEDSAVATVEFANGAIGTIVASTCAYPGFERRIEIHGDNGYALFRENRLEKLMVGGVEQEVNPTYRANASANPKNITCDEHKKQIENFIGAIEGREKLLIDCYEGRKAVSIIERIYRSNSK